MKGTDVTQEQMAQATAFLERSGNRVPEKLEMTREQLVRLMAWYAAVRGSGDGSGVFLVKPGRE